MNKTRDSIFTSFLHLLRVKHSLIFSDKYFNEHPHKYNLFGISKMLSDYGIENAGTKIIDKEKDIFNIELPFIAHFGSDFVVVYKVERNTVYYIWNGKKLSVPVTEFIQAWSGIILLAESTIHSIEPDYKKHKKNEQLNVVQKLSLFLSCVLILGTSYIAHALFTKLGLTLLLLINLAGMYISYLLILKQLYVQSNYADKICSLFSKSDCNNVLESKAAKLWGVFGWSEIGLGYFAANVLILLSVPDWISYLSLINLFTLPYSIWSVWYQKFKAKQWCPLCLIVQILLWLIFAVNWLSGYMQLPVFNWISLINLLVIACIYLIGMLGVNILIPLLNKGRMVESLKQEINSLKANEEMFKALLKQQPYFEASKSDSQILFGNPDAHLRITILTNPYCNPCAQMHKRVEKLLKSTSKGLCVQYIFASFDPGLDFANKHLNAIYLEQGPDMAMQTFNIWFEKGKALKEEFFKDFHLNIDNPVVENEFQKHESWKAKTQIRATPTILVNGYRLPENYRIEDLRYFTALEIDINNSLLKGR
jgi:protein-disulfide isomerase